MRTVGLGALLAVAVAGRVPAQGDVAGRLAGRVPPAVVAAVRQLAENAAARGLPVEPLVDKAAEGGAKGVPAERVIAAVRAVMNRLDQAATALRAAGLPTSDSDLIEAGAFAINAGLDARAMAGLAQRSRAPYKPAATLRVAGTLAALGVPATETVQLLQQAMDAGTSPGDLLDLPREVEVGVAHGASPAAAATGLGQSQGQGQGQGQGGGRPSSSQPHGPPPGKGQSHKP